MPRCHLACTQQRVHRPYPSSRHHSLVLCHRHLDFVQLARHRDTRILHTQDSSIGQLDLKLYIITNLFTQLLFTFSCVLYIKLSDLYIGFIYAIYK